MINKVINARRKIVIAGAGNAGMALWEELQKIAPMADVSFCDNSKCKQGKFGQYEIIGFDEAVEKYNDAIYIVANLNSHRAIKRQLLDMGIADDNIIADEILGYIEKLYYNCMEERKVKPVQYLRFEVSLAEHCNLNCAHCAHFSPIAEREFLDISVYEKDIKRLSELLEGRSGTIYLLGGEPLLFSEMERCMSLTREAFIDSQIVIVTNGLLICKMEESFFETCRKCDISVSITHYPINFDYDAAVKKLIQEKVSYDYYRMSDQNCVFYKYTFDLEGKQDPYESFTHCEMANQCHLLREGKVYTCSVIGCVQHFNKCFGKNLEVTEGDYVDIYKVNNAEELYNKLADPAPFCKYCDVAHRVAGIPFEISKRVVEEWV